MMLDIIRKNEERIFCALFAYFIVTSFVNQQVYAFTVRFASVLIFLVLGVMALPYIKEHIKERDPDMILMLLTPVFTFIFALMSGSKMGAVFIPTDIALISYVSKYLRLSKKSVIFMAFVGAVPVSLWYSHVRWSYNFNMAGFAFMLMACFAMILVEILDLKYNRAIRIVIYFTALILSILYHTRTAISGVIAVGVFLLLKKQLTGSRVFYRCTALICTAGSALFTLLYVFLSKNMYNATVLNKKIFSGREDIWKELWEAFFVSPATGIGSAYKMKSFEIFEVHNGMLDILVVHGVVVFIMVLILLVRMLYRMYDNILSCGADMGRYTALCSAYGLLIASFTENCFITPPYSIFFMTFTVMSGMYVKEKLFEKRK